MPLPGAREYIFVQQVAWPTGGTVRAGHRLWLTPQQYNALDPGMRGVMCDVEEWARRKAAVKAAADNEPRTEPPGLTSVGRAKLAGRSASRRKRLRGYATTMVDPDTVEDK